VIADSPIAAAKCSFSGGTNYFVEFPDYVVKGGLKSDYTPDISSDLDTLPAYMTCDDCDGTETRWIFSFDPSTLAAGEHFAYPFVQVCYGEESCATRASGSSGGGGGGTSDDDDDGMSTGAKATIGMGIILGIVLGAGISFFLIQKAWMPKKPPAFAPTAEMPETNAKGMV